MGEQKKPKPTAALRKALERAGSWNSLPDDDRTRAAKKKWLAKQNATAGKQAAAKKKVAAKKTAVKKRSAAPSGLATDPKLHAHEGYLSSEHATLPDLTPWAKDGHVSLTLDRKLKRAPELPAFLDACGSLRELHLHDSKLLAPAPKTSAVRHLELSASSTNSLAFLRGFPQLEFLQLAFRGSPKLKRLDELCYVSKLRRLHANQHGASTLAPLAKLNQLVEYSAESTKVLTSLRGLEGCTKLRHVNANLAPISDLGSLSAARQLVALKVRGARIKTLEPIHGAKKLQTLFAEKSHLSTLDGIARGLPGLRLLWIHSTRVKDLSPLRGMKSLLELDVAGLRVDDFSVLGDLQSLEHLDLYETSFSDLDLLASLPNLVSVRLEKTKVKKNDPRVKKLSAALKKKHGPDAGLHFKQRPGGLVRLGPTQSAFLDASMDSQEHSEQFLA